jgi:hypothetical protein
LANTVQTLKICGFLIKEEMKADWIVLIIFIVCYFLRFSAIFFAIGSFFLCDSLHEIILHFVFQMCIFRFIEFVLHFGQQIVVPDEVAKDDLAWYSFLAIFSTLLDDQRILQ